MKVPAPCAVALALFHLASAFPAPTAAPGELGIVKYGLDINEAHVLRPRQSPVVSVSIPPADRSSTKSAPASSSTSEQPNPPSTSNSSAPPASTSEPSSAPSSRASTTNPTPTSPSITPVVRTSISQTQIASTQSDGSVVITTREVVISVTETPSSTPLPPTQENSGSGSSGVSSSTVIGLSVAGGLAALVAIAFIAWKLTRKRFSQFDTDDGVINWPDVQKEPDVGTAPRPVPTSTSTTNSTVDLVKDPYAVPPLPVNNRGAYSDDPSMFYDPYRGPIPQTFSTPPTSTDGHPQGWVGGEAIPMSTYASGRMSPGPNLAYGGVDPMQRTGTPVQRMATPVQRMATPVGGAATFQEIVRTGTPSASGGPAPGYGYGYGYGGR